MMHASILNSLYCDQQSNRQTSIVLQRTIYKRDMTEDIPAVSHLSVAVTTEESSNVQITDGKSMASSSSVDLELYFRWAVVVIGVVGTAANAVVLYALFASKQHKKHLLIVNQNALDLFSSFFVVITYSLKLCNLHLTGVVGYWLCMLLLSENFIWWGITGSITNLAAITVDRYLIVVHHTWSKKYLRPWVIHLAMAVCWLTGIVVTTPIVFVASRVIDGVCYTSMFFNSNLELVASMTWYIMFFYVITIAIFIFCYGRILITVRHQARVMASHSGPSTSQSQSNQIKFSVIKTMIIVCAFFAVAWLPIHVYNVQFMINVDVTFVDGRYYASLFIAFFYSCTNPFIYVANFDPVKKILKDIISCKNYG